MTKQTFKNIPVADPEKSHQFFTRLGFGFNEQFCDDKANCLVFGDNLFAILLKRDFFQTFTKKPVADAMKSTQVLIAPDVDSKEKVDELVQKNNRSR